VKKIGLIAGNGRFPFLAAEEIKKAGNRIVAVALKEETDPAFENKVDKITWLPLGKFQKLIDFFKEEGINEALMAGQVKHTQLFAGLSLDLRAIKVLANLKNKKTDSILGAVADELLKEGIKLLPSHHFLKHLLPKKGLIAGPKILKKEKKDIDFGLPIAKQIAGLDIGQSIAVKDNCVLAVESIEGTNECIKRAASLGKQDIIVMKVSKPKQDWRFDIPVIGPETLNVMAEVKARVLAVEAEKTLMIDKEKLIEIANKNKISVVAL
jgi:DUF1009 family protein